MSFVVGQVLGISALNCSPSPSRKHVYTSKLWLLPRISHLYVWPGVMYMIPTLCVVTFSALYDYLFLLLSHDPLTLPNRFPSPDSYLGHQCAGIAIVLHVRLILTPTYYCPLDIVGLTPFDSY